MTISEGKTGSMALATQSKIFELGAAHADVETLGSDEH